MTLLMNNAYFCTDKQMYVKMSEGKIFDTKIIQASNQK